MIYLDGYAFRDFRYAFRQLRKSPAFTLVAILTLALGIGANTAVFTLVHAVMLRSLPVEKPEQLYSLGDNQLCCDTGAIQDSFTLYSYPLYTVLRDHGPEFGALAAFQSWPANLSVRWNGHRDRPEPYRGELVSGNYFRTLGVSAFAGRTIEEHDDRPNSRPVAMLSYKAWRQNFGLDSGVVGATFTLNGQPVTIIGVAPPGFFGETLRSDPPDFWIPLALEPSISRDNPLLHQRDVFWLYLIGRLQPGVAIAPLEARLTAQIRQWLLDEVTIAAPDQPRVAKMRMQITSAAGGIAGIRSTYGAGLKLLMGISALVLLIACANIANLLLARATSARSQTAVRIALGASRSRLIGQMLTEGVLLALLGGVAGVVFAFTAAHALAALAFRGAKDVPIDADPALPVLAFTLAISVLAGVVFSIAPAWRATRAHPVEALRSGSRSIAQGSALPQKMFLAAQAALAVVLLVGAGLLTETLRHLEDQRFGFETSGRLIVRLNPALDGYTPERLSWLYKKLDQRVPEIPGVLSSSYALHSPMDDWNWGARIMVQGRPPGPRDLAWYDRVSPRYFETIGTRVLRGRAIDEHDTPASRHVAVVNETFVQRYLPSQDPLGVRFGNGDASHSGDYEIVGVVEDTKYRDERAPADPMYFVPILQMETYTQPRAAAYQTWSTFIDSLQLRVAGRPESFQPAVLRALAEIDPNLTVIGMTSFTDQIGVRFNSPRLIARLTSIYGVLALVLASIGLYGVSAYLVACRTGEIGIRMALGARRSSVIGLIVRGSTAPIAIGIAAGIPAALAGGRAISSQLFGVKAYDPVVFAVAIAIPAICAILAAVLPASRAAGIDPVRALRSE
jgi:predicted permease